jgi:hypothetical protein
MSGGMPVARGLAEIRGAMTRLAFETVARTNVPMGGDGRFLSLLASLDRFIEVWEEPDPRTPEDLYRLGMFMGTLVYMSACLVDADGKVVPGPVHYPPDNSVAVAAKELRESVLRFTAEGCPPLGG